MGVSIVFLFSIDQKKERKRKKKSRPRQRLRRPCKDIKATFFWDVFFFQTIKSGQINKLWEIVGLWLKNTFSLSVLTKLETIRALDLPAGGTFCVRMETACDCKDATRGMSVGTVRKRAQTKSKWLKMVAQIGSKWLKIGPK